MSFAQGGCSGALVRRAGIAFAVIAATLQCSPAWAVPQIEVLIGGVDDPRNASVGDQIALRCRVSEDGGGELHRLPGGQPVSNLDLSLKYERGPEDGFRGEIQAASGRGTLDRNGLYVFRCHAGNESLAQGLANKPGVAVARLPQIGRAKVTLRTRGDFRPKTVFEVGEPLELEYQIFAEGAGEGPMRPASTQVLVREGQVDCGTDAPSALDAIGVSEKKEWTAERGAVEIYTPRETGEFTFLVSQSSGSGAASCQAASFKVVEDARPPAITIKHPTGSYLRWDAEDSFRVSGQILDRGVAGPADLTVTVSNGSWSTEAFISELAEEDDRYAFHADLPWAPGLQVIDVIARDSSGHQSHTMRSVYAGETFFPVPMSAETLLGWPFDIVMQPGRNLLFDTTPPLDSLNELVGLTPLLLEAWGALELPDPSYVDEEIENSVVKFRPDFKMAGALVPGRPEFRLEPANDALQFSVMLPMEGRVVVQCNGSAISVNRAICAAAGQTDGRFHVNVGGGVELLLRTRFTPDWPLGLTTNFDEDFEVVDRLAVANGLGNRSSINDAFRDEILSSTRLAAEKLIQQLWGCLDGDGKERETCESQYPFQTDSERVPTTGKTIPARAAVRFWRRERTNEFSFEMAHPSPAAERLDVTIPFSADAAFNQGSRINLSFTTGANFEAHGVTADSADDGETEDSDVTGKLLVDQGALDSHFPDQPPMLRWFGSGNRDLQGAVHLNFANKVIANLWAANLNEFELPLWEAIDDPLVKFAFPHARLVVRLKAPPRVAIYDGIPGLFLESGPVEIEIDLTNRSEEEELEVDDHPGNRLVFDTALIAKVSLAATEDGEGIAVSLNNPTGCEPSHRRFMSCEGLFSVELREWHGLNEWAPLPEPSESAADLVETDTILKKSGAKTEEGRYRSKDELEAFYRDKFADALGGYLVKQYSIALPDIPLPRIDFGDLQVAPIDLTNVVIPEEATGGRRSKGWIGIAFDVKGRETSTE